MTFREAFEDIILPELVKAFKPIYLADTNSSDPIPPGDYVSLNIVSLTPQTGFGNITKKVVAAEDETFDSDILEKRTTEDLLTVSFTAHASSAEKSQEIAGWLHNAIGWVHEHDLYDYGYSLNIIQPLQNRTAYLIDDFTYRFGFDVGFLTARTIERRTPTIEKIILNNEEVEL